MGIVFKAFDPAISRLVALKTIRTDGLEPLALEDCRSRFRREAQAAGNLNHLNIVTVHDFGDEKEILFLVMELLEGESLECHVSRGSLLPIERTVQICAQVCNALDYAHRRGVVHRDIKPSNIMLLEGDLAKVTDFGIAKIMAAQVTTKSGHVWGTPTHISPEQIMGREVDGRSDVFSLGAVMYQMLTGERPFPGDNVSTILYRVIEVEPLSPSKLDPAIPPGLSAVVTRALAKNPADRYQTCQALADALCRHKEVGSGSAPGTLPLDVSALREMRRPPPARMTMPERFGRRNKDWYYWKDQKGKGYFLALVNAKQSCSIRVFDSDDGRFLQKKYDSGDYQDGFQDYIATGTHLFLSHQPNLENTCKVRLPDWVLSELRRQLAHPSLNSPKI